MKLRHATALALMGWYLIVPYERGQHLDFAAVATFDGREACEQTATNLRENAVGSSAVLIDPNDKTNRSLRPLQKQDAERALERRAGVYYRIDIVSTLPKLR